MNHGDGLVRSGYRILLSSHKLALTCQIHLSTFLSIFAYSLINYFTYFLLLVFYKIDWQKNLLAYLCSSHYHFKQLPITLLSHLHKHKKKNVVSTNFLEVTLYLLPIMLTLSQLKIFSSPSYFHQLIQHPFIECLLNCSYCAKHKEA